jgi:multidrug resistance efflux pump
MAGALIFVVVMVLVVPVGVMVGGALWSAVFGFFATDDAKRRADGTPYAVEPES